MIMVISRTYVSQNNRDGDADQYLKGQAGVEGFAADLGGGHDAG
jgi:hypothetical protein